MSIVTGRKLNYFYSKIKTVFAPATSYGTCSTAAATAAKTVSVSDFRLVTGARVEVLFGNANTAASPTLNVGGTGARPIYYNNAVLTAYNAKILSGCCGFVYDGSHWRLSGSHTMVKGNSESEYRGGLVNITPANIGAAPSGTYGAETVNKGRRSGTAVGDRSIVLSEQSAADALFATVLGGYNNTASGSRSVILGGSGNTAGDDESAVLGGYNNTASGSRSVVLGGNNNKASGSYSVVLGGDGNRTSGLYSAVLGGYNNTASGSHSSVLGYQNEASNDESVMLGKYGKSMNTGGNMLNQVGDAFVIGNGTSNTARSNALRVTFAGDVKGTKAFQSSGADYAEFVKPWADGNIYGEDRVGYFVTVKDGLLYKADEGDYIIGITSGNPSVVGNADEDYYWRYERDEFNRIVMEDVPEMKIKTEIVRFNAQKTETKMEYVYPDDDDWDPEYDAEGNPMPNEFPYESYVFDDDGNPVMEEIEEICPVKDERTGEYVMEETGKIIKNARMKLAEGYDSSKQDSYVQRADRPEWDYVGMVGVLPVRDDGTCMPGQFCKCGGNGIATLATERGFDTYMVLERIAENVVSVILK